MIMEKFNIIRLSKTYNDVFSKYSFENIISNTNIVKEWYNNIVNDTANHPIIVKAIEDQIEVSDEICIELKIEMKELFI